MLLIEKVQELQAIQPPLDPTEMNRRIAEWKKQTGYKAPEAIEVKEVKTQDFPEKDPNEKSQNNTGSVVSDSGSGKPTFTSMYDEDIVAQNSLNKINQNIERGIIADAQRALATSRVSFEDPYAGFDELIEEEGIGEAGKIDLQKAEAVLPVVDKSERVPDQVRSFIEAEALSKEQFDSLQNEFFNNEDLFKPITRTRLAEGSAGSGMDIKAGLMTPGLQEQYTVYPNQAELDKAKKQLLEKPRKKGDPKPTQEDIEYRARQNMFNAKARDIRMSNATDWLFNITDPEERAKVREEIGGYIVEKKDKATWEIDDYAKDLEFDLSKFKESSLVSDFKNYTKGLKEKQKAIKTLQDKIVEKQKKGLPVTEDLLKYREISENYKNFVGSYNKLGANLRNEQMDLENRVSEYTEMVSTIKESETQLDALKRIYNKTDKRFTDLGLGFAGLFSNSTAFLETASNYLGAKTIILDEETKTVKEAEGSTFFQDVAKKVSKAKEFAAEKYYKPITFDKAFSSLENFGEYAIDQVVAQAPIFAAIASGNAGMLGVSAASAGEYQTSRQLEAKQIGGRKYDKDAVFLQSLGFGAAEYAFGVAPTSLILRGFGKSSTELGKRKLFDGWKNYFKYVKENGALDIGLAAADALGEGLTTIAQNGIDGRPLGENVAESIFSGGMFGATFAAAPYFKGAFAASLSDYSTTSDYRANLKMMQSLQNAIDSPFTSKQDKEAFEKQRKELEDQNNKIVEDRINLTTNNLNKQGGELLSASMKRQEELRVQAEALDNNDAIPADQKKAMISALQNEFNTLEAGADKFKKAFTNTFGLLKTTEQNRLKTEATRLLQVDGVQEPSGTQIARKAEQLHVKEKLENTLKSDKSTLKAMAGAGIDVKYNVSDTNKQAIDEFTKMMNARAADSNNSITEEQAKAEIDRFTEGIKSGRLNGYNVSSTNLKTGKKVYDSITSVQNSIANERSQTSLHELGHVILTEALGIDSAAFKEGSDLILSYLKEANPEAYTRISTRTKGQGADEVFTVFFEEVADGKIKLDKAKGTGFLGYLGSMLGTATSQASKTDYNYNFKGETDIIKFSKEIGRKLKDGTLTVGDVKTIQEEGLAGKTEVPVQELDEVVVTAQAASTESKASIEVKNRAQELIIKSKSEEKLTRKEEADLQTQLEILALDALGFKQGKGTATRQEALSFVNQYIPGIVRRFDPKRNLQISTLLFRNISPKKQRFYGEELQLEKRGVESSLADERVGELTTEETKTETVDIELAKKPSETTRFNENYIDSAFKENNDTSKEGIENKITETVTESFKDRPVKNFKETGKIPQALAKLYADMFGIKTVNALIEKQRNLQKLDEPGAIRARQFLIDNAATDFARLPRVKDDLGKATGIFQTKLGKVMYNKNGKLVGTLKQYKDIIQGKEITLPDYNGNEITFNARDAQGKKKPIYRDSQHITAALDFHIRNRAFETLVPLQGKRVQLGAKFSLETRQDLNWKKTDEDIQTTFEVKGKKYTTRLEETAFMEFDEGQTYDDIDDIAKKLGIQKDSEGDDISSSERFYHLQFADKAGKMDITGAGNAAEVFSVNINGVVDYLKNNPEIEGVIFTAKEASRIRLYKRLAEAMADKLGGTFGFENDTFIVAKKTKPEAKLSEEVKITPASLRKAALAATGSLTGGTFKNFTVKELKDMGFETVADVKRAFNLNIRPDDNRPITSSGFKALGGNVQVMTNAVNEFLKEFPQYREIIRRSTTSSMKRNSMVGATYFDKVVPKVEGKFDIIKRDPYKGKDKKLTKGFVKKTNSKDYLRDQYSKLKYLENFWIDVQSYLKDNKDQAFMFEQMLDDSQNNMGSLMRISPPILFLPLKNGKIDFTSIIREEHNFPANQVGSMLLDAAMKGNVEEAFKVVSAAYMQGPLIMSDDNKIDVDFKRTMPDFFWDTMVPRILSGDLKIPEGSASVIRLSEAGVNLDNYLFLPENQTFSEYFFGTNGLPVQTQNALLKEYFSGESSLQQIRDYGKKDAPIVAKENIVAPINNEMAGKLSIEGDNSNNSIEVVKELSNLDAAARVARKLNNPIKKARIFDFDDTLARSNSKVIVTMPFLERGSEMADIIARRLFKKEFENLPSYKQTFNSLTDQQQIKVLQQIPGAVTEINATQFAEQAGDLEAQGATFDFSQFEKVIDGKKGPLFKVAENIANARGTEDIFILTARPQAAAGPIQEFMKALGINIPLGNITGLGDGKASAKGRWVASKAAEGYNDFYFADDAVKNVAAVKEVLDQVDVKYKVQIAKASKENTFNTIVNDMIFDSSGIETYKQFSAAKAKTVGANKGKYNFLIPASAEDFTGLLYKMLGKGKKGDAQMAFLKTNLLDPYMKAEDTVVQAKMAAANDFMALKQEFPGLPKTFRKETGIGGFTYQHAIRTYIWNKQGMSIPGLSKADIRKLSKFVKDNTDLRVFADQLITLQKGKLYPEPGKDWLGGNLTTDIIGGINKISRAEAQQEFRENLDIIFSPENLSKMEAAYGTRWRRAMEDSIRRMKAGTNRPIGSNPVTEKIFDWLNNSVGAVMFLNTRSALLQTISAVNFINWGDNNIVAAGKAFANQKQYWKDFMSLMNSDYLVQRRNGLKINVSESEIADAVKDSKNKPRAAIAFLLSKGFVMTRFADSFAIASGGATFYRNRIKKYIKEGMDQKLAEEKAFDDFRALAEENQQSSDPSKISMQQASAAGRVILAWANTPMQYARIQKRSAQDLIAGRGDWKTHVSKIAYYGFVQNLIFNALQQALFAIGFGDDDEDEDPKKKARADKKIARVANGMIDSQLKGLGIAGTAVAAVKNMIVKLYDEHGKKTPEYEAASVEALGFSPPLNSKYRKLVGGLKSFSWNRKEMKEKGFSLDNPAYLAGAQIISAFTNVPVDRVVKKANNVRGLLSNQTETWQKVALGLGWGTYDIGLPYYGGWDKPKDPTPEEIKQREFDTMKKDTKTSDQVQMLLDLGLDKKQIKALRYEDARVKKIIELQNKKKDGITTIRKDK